MREFVYRDFGSLVSLGKHRTIGSLMGFVIGRSFFVEGYFARLMYRSLYKMHEAALHGRGRTLLSLLTPAGARPAPTVIRAPPPAPRATFSRKREKGDHLCASYVPISVASARTWPRMAFSS